MDQSIQARSRVGDRVVEKTVSEYAAERDRKLPESLGRGSDPMTVAA